MKLRKLISTLLLLALFTLALPIGGKNVIDDPIETHSIIQPSTTIKSITDPF